MWITSMMQSLGCVSSKVNFRDIFILQVFLHFDNFSIPLEYLFLFLLPLLSVGGDEKCDASGICNNGQCSVSDDDSKVCECKPGFAKNELDICVAIGKCIP